MLKMKKELVKDFNKQINLEYFSAYLYLAMSDWLLQNGFVGSAHWMAVQSGEEVAHAEGLLRYLQLRGEKVNFAAIEQPKSEWDSWLNLFEEALAHEESITESIDKLVDAAEKAGDKAAVLFLDWYVLEQIEEEDNATNNILGINRCKDDVAAQIQFDLFLGRRQYEKTEIPNL